MPSDNQVLDICSAHGLSVGSFDVDTDILVLCPSNLEGLPDAESLRTIAEELKVLGYRWVSIELPEAA